MFRLFALFVRGGDSRRRRHEMRWLRAQLRSVARVGADRRMAAKELVRLKRAHLIAQGPLQACRRCARGAPLPHGAHAGGFCCGGATDGVFGSHELAALHAAGLRGRHLRPARGALAGCVFRGREGCVLDPGDRPVVCVTHYCREAQRELARRGNLAAVEDGAKELLRRLRAFSSMEAGAKEPS